MSIHTLQSHWLPACRKEELRRKPLAVTVLDQELVLFRTRSGVHALMDRCPHRNVPLSGGVVQGDRIMCPYHGWEFDGNGVCTRVPGLCSFKPGEHMNAAAVRVAEQDGFIWIKLPEETPAAEGESAPASLPFMKDPTLYSFVWKTAVRGTLLNAAENLLDATHTHYVHAGLIRTDKNRQRVKACITASGSGVEIEYSGESGQAGLISRIFERDRQTSYGRFLMPGVAQIEYRSSKGLTLLITALMKPTSADYQDIYAIVTVKRGLIPGSLKKLVITPFLKKALKQDIRIVEVQQAALERAGGEDFHSTQADLIRPYLEQLMRGRVYSSRVEKTVYLHV
ncbi:aromatic ring-hydroxylating oxygenase subunit alpha [Paenibacillus lutrae]|uniref:Rieske 2Fe-2S domain-containing protein n=1 Tax=Paenibacillus lutrae TaxID=2078573 RepID=A0A7X3FKR9_9BACL|nr:aromatic ring-hydroxylating dioxygenase subunit alpha [Paenibacillus lutrae]MVP01157.1 Rieske 2Fe-2S domain-containing protein [Paenibacillus lutrae]